jgi:hypothetical protein
MLAGKKDDGGKDRKAVDCIREVFPMVADILGGIEAGKGQPAILPGTISFWLKDGVARFSVNVKSAEMSFIGDVADLANPFKSVELAMVSGKVSSKRYTERASSMTPEQEKLLL